MSHRDKGNQRKAKSATKEKEKKGKEKKGKETERGRNTKKYNKNDGTGLD